MKFNHLKSKALALGGALLGVPAFAEGTSQAVDLTEATSALTSWKEGIVSFLSDATPVLVAILGAGIVIMAIWLGWKILKRGSSKLG